MFAHGASRQLIICGREIAFVHYQRRATGNAVACRSADFPANSSDRRCAFSYLTGRSSTTAGGPTVTPPKRLAFIGNSLPRRCGIATFTTDLQQAVARSRPGAETAIVAMNDSGQAYDYPPDVRRAGRRRQIEDYVRAADSSERRAVRCRLAAARIRHLRRRSRRPCPDAAVAAEHARW